jgi:hypothetical protein
MRRVTGIVAIAGCGLALTGCGSWMPSLDFTGAFNSAPTSATLRIESEPPGADARVSTGPTCKTPCSVPVPASGDFTVSFALNGFLPQTVPVHALPPENREFGQPPVVRFDPSPVLAQLEPAPPPPGKKRNKKPVNRTANTQKPAPQ